VRCFNGRTIDGFREENAACQLKLGKRPFPKLDGGEAYFTF
jgi:hypothetical protein